MRYPALEELTEIIERTTHVREVEVRRVMTGPQVLGFRELVRETPIASHIRDLASLIVLSTHPQWERAPESARRFIRYGASPRGAQALVLGAKVRALAEGRYNVSVEDLRAIALPALRHRLILNFEGEAEGVDVDRLIGELVDAAESMSSVAERGLPQIARPGTGRAEVREGVPPCGPERRSARGRLQCLVRGGADAGSDST